MIIIGLDLALNHCGWATINTDANFYGREWGVWKNPFGKASFPLGQRLCYIREQLESLIATSDAAAYGHIVVWKEGIVRHFKVIQLGAVHGVADEICWEFGIVPREVAPDSIKVLATNNGHASKPEMVAAAVNYLGYKPFEIPPYKDADFDAADALWVADFGARIMGYDRPPLPVDHLRALKLEEPA